MLQQDCWSRLAAIICATDTDMAVTAATTAIMAIMLRTGISCSQVITEELHTLNAESRGRFERDYCCCARKNKRAVFVSNDSRICATPLELTSVVHCVHELRSVDV